MELTAQQEDNLLEADREMRFKHSDPDYEDWMGREE